MTDQKFFAIWLCPEHGTIVALPYNSSELPLCTAKVPSFMAMLNMPHQCGTPMIKTTTTLMTPKEDR
jgi:hypothetical protein